MGLGEFPEVDCRDMVTSINLFPSKSRLNEFEEPLILLNSVVYSPQRPSQNASLEESEGRDGAVLICFPCFIFEGGTSN